MIGVVQLIIRGFLIGAFRIIGLSVRVIDNPMDQIVEHHRNGQQVLFAVWHEFSVVGIYWYRHKRASALVGDSWKSDILAGIMRHFGFTDFRTNATGKLRRDGRGVLGFIRYLRAGHDGTIAMDGPNGPARQAKPGILHIALKSNTIIIPCGAYFSHAITFNNRWDNYQVPLPFSRVHILFGDPFVIPEDFRSRESEILAQLNQATTDITEQARRVGDAYKRRGRKSTADPTRQRASA